MRQIWHIFKKDVRRFWPQTLATLVLLAWFANDATWYLLPSAAESWLNLLLPFAWAVLLGLAVLEDAVANDSRFWLALPCRGRTMLVAKSLFALTFVHAPYFIACSCIIAMRGFSPARYVPEMLEKQLLIALLVTVPAIALASLVRNAAHFALGVVLLAAGMILAQSLRAPYANVIMERYRDAGGSAVVALALLSIGSIAVVALQYARKSAKLARGAAIATMLVASLAYAGLPKETAESIGIARSEEHTSELQSQR